MKNNNERVKMFLFARWISTSYADEHMDNNGKSQHESGFNKSNYMSVLNRESGDWYKKQLDYFEKTVYPNYVKNGSVSNAEKFLK